MVNPTYMGTKADGICVFFLSVMAQMQSNNNMVPNIFFKKIAIMMIKVQKGICFLIDKTPGRQALQQPRAMGLDK